MAKSAIEKRDGAAPPKVEVLEAAKGSSYPPGRMLVPSPLEVDAIVRRIPEGRVLAVGELRANMARNHRADYTCPMTTGIFLRIVGEAAEEERALRGGAIAPYWRVVHDDGTMLDKLPGGPEVQARRLADDGVTVLHLGKPRVDVEHFGWHPPLLGKAAARRPAPSPGPAPARARAEGPRQPPGRPSKIHQASDPPSAPQPRPAAGGTRKPADRRQGRPGPRR
ncbi:MAG TPA: hypothetical protein VHE35_30225 [Kofleriaceae bacterium]|nr:hypothetical protein [Kofleriaceae bacterium]